MSRQLVFVSPDDDLHHVRSLFERHGFHHLLVREQSRLVGLVSDRDLLRALSPFIGKLSERQLDLATLNRRVHQIMSRHVVGTTPDASVSQAATCLLSNGVSCLPVVTSDGRPVGIVTWRDILRVVAATPIELRKPQTAA
jgi:acetoin utilization protein AcuB